MPPRMSPLFLIVSLASALVFLVAARQASWAQEVPDLIVNSGETYTMLPGVYEYNQVTISPNAVLRTTGTVSVTAS